jgi:hypothetical protein
MHAHPRWLVRQRLVWILAAALLCSIPVATRPAAADRPMAPLAMAERADQPARAVPCRQNVYPLMPNSGVLMDNPPAWYRPVTMASIGLSPDADETDIPGLNTTTSNSPRFRLDVSLHGHWVVWRSTSVMRSESLVAMFDGPGNLSNGFQENPNPWWDPAANAHINGVLDAGDWLDANFDELSTPIAALGSEFDAHIAQKTRMILPVFDQVETHDLGEPYYMHVQRLIEVRLLDYALTRPEYSMEGYLEFALLDDDKVCAATDSLYMPITARSAPAAPQSP